MSKVEQWAPSKYIEINPTRAVDVQKEEGNKYHVPSMDDLLRVQEEDRVMIRFINKANVWLSVVRIEEDGEDDEAEDDHPVATVGHSDEHPDIAERKLFCRVLASEEIKKLKEPTLQENQRVKIRYEHIVKVDFMGATDSEDEDFY